MQFRHLACLFGLFLLSGQTQAEDGTLSSDNSSLTMVLQHASETQGSPYFLQVNCTDQRGIRSFELFPGGATIWNKRSQIMVPPSGQSALLKTLTDQKFSTFEGSYGGNEQPAKSAGPARVTCRIRIEIQDLEKSSVQMAGGEQSKQFSALATALLDQAERYLDSAVSPVDLQDALDMLYEGQLAPQILQLRYMELPTEENSKPGFILRLYGNQLSRQAYKPGVAPAKPTVEPLDYDQYVRLVAAMRKEQLASLPANLWSEDHLELEVQVLTHKTVVLARRFSRLENVKQDSLQRRLDNLLIELRQLAH